MKALRFYAPEDVRLEDVPEPECGPGEIKLRVRNCSTCGTDVKIFYNGHQNLTPPRTIGHEIAGEVVEVGADVNATYGSSWAVGDRAQVIAAVPCGECYECKKGWMAVCQNQTSVGYQYDGGFAEYMIVPRQVLKVDGLNRIPDNVGFDEASAAEPFADVIITATAANITQEQAIAMAARNGRISFFGGLPKTDPTITCDSNVVHYRQLHIHGANGSAPEHNKRALQYISTGQVPVKDLITRHIPIDNVLDAFDIVKKGEAIKVTVEPAPAEVPTP